MLIIGMLILVNSENCPYSKVLSVFFKVSVKELYTMNQTNQLQGESTLQTLIWNRKVFENHTKSTRLCLWLIYDQKTMDTYKTIDLKMPLYTETICFKFIYKIMQT